MAHSDLHTPLEADRLEARLPDRKPMLSEHAALAEANRCLYCADAPCIASCPTHIDIPEFIRQISTDNLAGSAQTIFAANILGYSCARVCPVEVLCEGSCVFNELGAKPISIGKLQRYATEQAYQHGWRFDAAGPDTGKKVACIGAGPASLACAHELRRLGHAVTIFEARPVVGGLNTTGIAPYKIDAEGALREVNYVLGIGGVEVRTSTAVGKDVSLAQLERDFDAVFVGAGLGADSGLDIPGEELEGVMGAVEWIEKLKLEGGYALPAGVRDVVIAGGGNTALDVVREMLGVGVENVTLLYRRDSAGMPGYQHEWQWARVEGARAEWLALPVELLGEGGKLSAVRCARTRLVGADGARPKVEVLADQTFEIPCQLFVAAIGQGKLGSLFADVDGIALDRGKIVVDAETGQTGNQKYFAGGDCISGGKEVVNASAEGKIAAQGIHAFLTAE